MSADYFYIQDQIAPSIKGVSIVENKENKSKATESVDQITCNGVPLVKLAEEEYVYDVYTMQRQGRKWKYWSKTFTIYIPLLLVSKRCP